MHRVIHLLILTYGNWNHPSSRIRAVQYIDFFKKSGQYHVKWIPRISIPGKGFKNKYFTFPIIKRWLFLFRFIYLIFNSVDQVFVQRDFLSKLLLRLIQAKRIKLIYDFDDAIYLETSDSSKNQDKTARMIKAAYAVIVSSDDLIQFASAYNPNVYVIPSPVDIIGKAELKKSKSSNELVTVGWIGSVTTTKYLKEIIVPFTEIGLTTRFRFLVIGAGEQIVIPGIEVVQKEWSFEKEAEFLDEMDVGIMPLPENDWTQGKGGYKLILYSSAGLPLIASPVGINKRIVVPGSNGFLAGTRNEWIKYIRLLLDDEDMRLEMGAKAMEIAKENYSREVCFNKLISIIGKS
jgi:glycosyltransferase involved in cell wall biosynthesis